jgi:hypothetical protein
MMMTSTLGNLLRSAPDMLGAPEAEKDVLVEALRDPLFTWLSLHGIAIPSHLTAATAIPPVAMEETLRPLPPTRQRALDATDWRIQHDARTVDIALLYRDVAESLFDKCIHIRIPVVEAESVRVHVEECRLMPSQQALVFLAF